MKSNEKLQFLHQSLQKTNALLMDNDIDGLKLLSSQIMSISKGSLDESRPSIVDELVHLDHETKLRSEQ